MKDVMVYKMNEKITVIGPAIIDVLAGPINENLFKASQFLFCHMCISPFHNNQF